MSIKPQSQDFPEDPYFSDSVHEEEIPYGDLFQDIDEGEYFSFDEQDPNTSLNAKQKRILSELEKSSAEFNENYETLQEQLSELQSGEQDLEQKKLNLENIEALLQNLEAEFRGYHDKELLLVKTGLAEQDLDAYLGNTLDPSLEDEMKEIENTLSQEQAAIHASETENIEAERKSQEGIKLKDRTLDTLQYLNGDKDRWYYSGKVLGAKHKHIYRYHENIQSYAQGLIGDIAQAFSSGEWKGVEAVVCSLGPQDVDNTLTLVYSVLQHAPQVLEAIPSQVLTLMSDSILKGNNPGSKNVIWYIQKGEGKYNQPKNDRRRQGNHSAQITGNEASRQLSMLAKINERLEKASKPGSLNANSEIETAAVE